MRNGCELEAAPMLGGAGHEELKDTWDTKIVGKSFHIGTAANVFQTYFMHIRFNVISKKQVVKKLAVGSLGEKFPKPLVSCPSCPAPRALGGAP